MVRPRRWRAGPARHTQRRSPTICSGLAVVYLFPSLPLLAHRRSCLLTTMSKPWGRVMAEGDIAALSALITKHEAGLLTAWMRNQLEAGSLRSGQIKEDIGLRPASAPINLQAGWIDNQASDAPSHEEARQPECIISNLIAERDRRHLADRLGTAIACDQKL